MVGHGSGYISAGGGRWCVVVDKFWLVMGSGGYVLTVGGWWHSLV